MSLQETKILIKQLLVNYAPLSGYFSTLPSPVLNMDDVVWEVGTDLVPTNIIYPLIRFGITRNRVYDCGGCSNCSYKCTIDYYIETATDDSQQNDEIRDILSDLMHIDCGRYIGTYSESPAFQAIVVANPFKAWTWDFREILNSQKRESEETANISTPPLTGLRNFGYMRYIGYIEEQIPV